MALMWRHQGIPVAGRVARLQDKCFPCIPWCWGNWMMGWQSPFMLMEERER